MVSISYLKNILEQLLLGHMNRILGLDCFKNLNILVLL
ncbi:hypothetical protein LEP1GSC026_3799 [Leptospira interrogans str. 2002000623]|nr:hypothetical protein LEP1GSC025_2955 [Leptospira interrogans str. 2002000621]EKQ48083.1 hypothetical protein LEP1GSC026_3799 [Leptospira interrogans str. 2002000623]EMJ73100.1 hypothetical protein LEP1GSC033_1177 [Leptospira interrogans str. 2002000632]